MLYSNEWSQIPCRDVKGATDTVCHSFCEFMRGWTTLAHCNAPPTMSAFNTSEQRTNGRSDRLTDRQHVHNAHCALCIAQIYTTNSHQYCTAMHVVHYTMYNTNSHSIAVQCTLCIAYFTWLHKAYCHRLPIHTCASNSHQCTARCSV